MALWLTELR